MISISIEFDEKEGSYSFNAKQDGESKPLPLHVAIGILETVKLGFMEVYEDDTVE